MGSLLKYIGAQAGKRGQLHWSRVSGDIDGLPFRGSPPLFRDEEEASQRLVPVGDTYVGIFNLEQDLDYQENGTCYYGRKSLENVLDCVGNGWFSLAKADWRYDKQRHLVLVVWTEWFMEDKQRIRFTEVMGPQATSPVVPPMPSSLTALPAPPAFPPPGSESFPNPF